MSKGSGGFYIHQRNWQDDPIFKSESFSERDAWSWLLGKAAWKECQQKVGGHFAYVKRGQLAVSVRFLKARWGWGQGRVERFLEKLSGVHWLSIEACRHYSVITLIDYELSQRQILEGAESASGYTSGYANGYGNRYASGYGETGSEQGTEGESETLMGTQNKTQTVQKSRQTRTNKQKSAALPDEDENFQKVRRVLQECAPNLAQGDLSIVNGWIRNGADLELDIIPIIRKKTAGRGVGSMTYFSNGIAEALERRVNPLSMPKKERIQPKKKKNVTPAGWGIDDLTGKITT